MKPDNTTKVFVFVKCVFVSVYVQACYNKTKLYNYHSIHSIYMRHANKKYIEMLLPENTEYDLGNNGFLQSIEIL